MADFTTTENPSIDLRLYLAMILFRWQVITVCFLYGLLGGVLFLQLTPKKYVVRCNVRAFADDNLRIEKPTQWAQINWHIQMLQNNTARNQAVKALAEEWGEKVGDKRKMYLSLHTKRRSKKTMALSVRSEFPEFAVALLQEVLKIHQAKWEDSRVRVSQGLGRVLARELEELEERINQAENDVFDYARIHDIRREELHAEAETGHIGSLVGKRRALRTQMWMMEVMFPALKDENIAVIEDVATAFRVDEDGNIIMSAEALQLPRADDFPLERFFEGDGAAPGGGTDEALLALEQFGTEDPMSSGQTPAERGIGYVTYRYELVQLKANDDELAERLKPDHPKRTSIARRIAHIEAHLAAVAEIELRGMLDAYKALQITHDALEAAEYKWTAVNYQRARKQSELKRLQAKLARYESNYKTLYKRLHEIKMNEETRIERFSASTPSASSQPVWPDPTKVLLIALAIGLGSGCGIAILAQIMDNKIQSIADVEKSLGIPFLGGVPFWVHSGLERAIRPIVTEEHSVGAVEAYRALRTSIIAALDKAGEKILMVTSADSREGKTLTALNSAIMMAQMRKKVLLVDMDLRRGRLHRSLGLEKEPGMCDVLRKTAKMKDIIVPTRIEGLFLAPPGKSVEDAPELLQSAGMEDIFLEVSDEYDYIIIDTSPVLRVTDTVVLATQGFGAVLYVARVNHTPKPLVRYSLDVLKDARVIGMVLNSIEMHKISSLYYTYQYPNYAYYSNAYSYGYSYAYYGDQADTEGKKFKRKGGLVNTSKRSVKKWFNDTFLPMQ